MTLSKLRLPALFMAVITMICTLTVYGADISSQTVPGYMIVNTYNEKEGTITSDIYVTDGIAIVGQVGLSYNTDLVILAALTSDGRVITEYEEQLNSDKLTISYFVKGSNNCVMTAETNKVSNLVNNEDGEFFFAWYLGGASKLDATQEDKKVATVTFKVNEGVSKEELEKCGKSLISFAANKPTASNVVGYSAGAYVANEENTAVRNNGRSKFAITLLTEYKEIDIAGGFDVQVNENDLGINLPDTFGTSGRIVTVPMGTEIAKIKSVFSLPTGMSAELCTTEGTTDIEKLKTGDFVTLTKGNHTEKITIAVKSDTDKDGNATMSDLNTMMRIISGNIENPAPEAMYAVDTNGDGVLSDAEYNEFLTAIIEGSQK